MPASTPSTPRKLWDISPPVDENAAVFPGDTAYSQQLHFSLEPGCPVNVNAITLSPHTGAHADAPLHYANGEASIGEVDLPAYLGPCRVIHCMDCGPLVLPEHIAHALDDLPPRVLLRTSHTASQSWESFTAVAQDTLALLATKNIALIGIDTPSVDPATSQDLPSHHQLLAHGLRVLENLVLDEVPEGDYELIALPLKLMRADASPVRAILRELS
ncbi:MULTISPECIES: arylformamidase [unclassified Polaromonas]|uniref:arylformamidase n=1 Tax=unclassified Polaromonas TaxID=2638319 RepID=UPI000F08F210|nr:MULTISPECIES: arylformamidase [unclassified Polaromonas]AYQ28780.1 arylformamidase [Polaromonas sp. SP1]QGJ20105.1 arylformamidase [Polaromonas sp. Pch-P]